MASDAEEPQTDQSEKTDEYAWVGRIDYNALDEFVTALSAVVDECRLRIEEDRIMTEAVDPANVAMTRVELAAEAFEVYQGGDAEIGLPLYRLRDQLEHWDPAEPITLKYREEWRKMELESGPYSYTLALIHPDSIRQDPDLPTLDLSATVGIKSDEYADAIMYAKETGDRANVGYDPTDSAFYVYAQGDTDDAEFRVSRESLADVPRPGEADSLFSLDYQRDLVEQLPEGRVVTLDVGNEYPMTMTFGIAPVDGSGTRYLGEVTYLQAPRIMSDGDDDE